jgi:hypothetical protein
MELVITAFPALLILKPRRFIPVREGLQLKPTKRLKTRNFNVREGSKAPF